MNQPPKPKIRTCNHYFGSGGGIIAGTATTTLQPISNDKCRCYQCQKEFPIDYMITMTKLTKAFRNAGCCDVNFARLELQRASRPVKYIVESGKIRYIDE